MSVKPKKHLGQHFLKDESIAEKIANIISESTNEIVLEIGPGMGVLTKYLLQKKYETYAIEIDTESIAYLQNHYPSLKEKIIHKDFLKINLGELFTHKPFAIIGNFPYNISTQIVFKVLEHKNLVPEFAGMFQKEVALRIASKPGNKVYGILSVLTQAFYDVKYLFDVSPTEFNPPPKVTSGVIHMKRKENYTLPVNEDLFFKVVKSAFNHRRKTLRNSLKVFDIPEKLKEDPIFALRAEQLSVADFIHLTNTIQHHVV